VKKPKKEKKPTLLAAEGEGRGGGYGEADELVDALNASAGDVPNAADADAYAADADADDGVYEDDHEYEDEQDSDEDEDEGEGEERPRTVPRRGGAGGWNAAKHALDLDEPNPAPKMAGGTGRGRGRGGGRGRATTAGGRGAGRGRGRGRGGRGKSRGGAAEDGSEYTSSEDEGEGGAPKRRRKRGRDTSGLDPDALDVVMGTGVQRGGRIRTALGNAYFALEDETPFFIGQKLHVYGNQLLALNSWCILHPMPYTLYPEP
jgi:hypothetical protein